MRRKLRVDRLIILIAIVVAIVLLLFFGVKALFFGNEKPTETAKPQPTFTGETTKNVSIELLNYEVYEAEDLDFRFVIGEFKFSAKEPIQFDLGKLETNELITLDRVEKYESLLKEKSYTLAKTGIVTSVASHDKSYTCKLFIPVTKSGDHITLTNLMDSSQIRIDLTQKKGDITALKNQSGENITDGSSYDIHVSNAYVSTTMYRGEEEYTYPATIKVYTFELTVDSLEEEIQIVDAKFIPSGSSEEYPALDASYSSMKKDNILNRPLKVNDNYALFFEMFSPEESGITYSGTLLLKFSNSDSWVEIATTME